MTAAARCAPAPVRLTPALRTALVGGLVCGLVGGLAGCAGPSAPPRTEIRLTASGFDPATVRAVPGTDVRFVNRSGEAQRLASLVDAAGTAAVPEGEPALDSGRLPVGETWAARLEVPGAYVVGAMLAGNHAVVTILVEEEP